MRLLTAGSSVRARQGEPNTLGVCNLLREHSRSKLYKEIRAFSSVGQSNRLITGRSRVRIPEGPPFISQWYRGIAQLVEQWSPKPRAEGSSPSAPAKYADVAQVVAHILGKDEVTSSSLVISSKRKRPRMACLSCFWTFLFCPKGKTTGLNVA